MGDSRLVGSRIGASNIGRHHRHSVKSWGKPDVVTHNLIPELEPEPEPEPGPGPSLSLKPTHSV